MNVEGLVSVEGRLTALLETMRAFAEAANDTRRLLDTVTERITRLMGEGCSLYVKTEEGTEARPIALTNLSEERASVVRSAFGASSIAVDGAGVIARVISEGKLIRISVIDAEVMARAFRPEDAPALAKLELRSLLVVPLQVQGTTIGALAITRHGENDRPFTAEDEIFAQTLADHAALALRNAQLLESLQRELAERRKAEEETKKFVALVQRSRDLISMATLDGRVLFINDAGRELLGLEPSHDISRVPLSTFHTEEGLKRQPIVLAQGHWEGEGVLRHFVTGELIPVQVSSLVLRASDGEPLCFATVQRDLRATRRLEEHLRQAQKMEAIGRLAGGVAHDFNNMLSVILSYGSLLMEQLPRESDLWTQVHEIFTAGERAAALTQQLLAFSRRQVLEPRVLDPNEIIGGMREMTRRLLGEDVELVYSLGDGIKKIAVDPTQMEQVVMNLAVNARDAMPRGGTLRISTANVTFDTARSHASDLAPGDYVRLTVSDSGVGMDPSIVNRIFEPFYTTKEKGKGTGLGLATVLGIVEQSGGRVLVRSTPGNGTTFELYIPVTDRPIAAVVPRHPGKSHPRGTETILIVEDDVQVRALMSGILRNAGYQVLDASEPARALETSERFLGAIALLVTDVVMPRMDGQELVARLSKHRPEMKALYVSGYTEEAIGRRGGLEDGIALLRKPVTPEGLLLRVRAVLDEPHVHRQAG
jgi:PAS domain S-box-containing protein